MTPPPSSSAPTAPTEGFRTASQLAADRSAVVAFCEQHRRPITGYLAARLSCGHTTDDLVQEVFLRFLTRLPDLPDVWDPVRFLYGVARIVLKEHVRKHRARRELAWTAFCLELETVLPPDRMIVAEETEALMTCLTGLGPSAREAIDRHYRDGQRLAEIATAQARSEGAVKLLLFRARQTLRDCLTRKLSQESLP